MKKFLPILIVAILIVAGGAFYGGMKYSASQKVNARNTAMAGRLGGTGARGNYAGIANATLANGDIIAKDDKSITVKLRDGGSKIVFFSASTAILKSTAGTVADLKIGDTIMANGATTADGSLSAQSIQLRGADLVLPKPLPKDQNP